VIDTHDYQVRIQGTGQKTGIVADDEGTLPSLEFASPPEFGGPGATWSPEHLFVASVATCLMTTFSSIASASDLEVLEYRDDATGRLERGTDRLYRMESITLRPTVVVADESKVDKAQRLLAKAENACLISRSIASRVHFEPKVSVASIR
jgi:peroxiredoxin-like protein